MELEQSSNFRFIVEKNKEAQGNASRSQGAQSGHYSIAKLLPIGKIENILQSSSTLYKLCDFGSAAPVSRYREPTKTFTY